VTGAAVTAIGSGDAARADAAPLGARALLFPHAKLIAEETTKAACTPRHPLIATLLDPNDAAPRVILYILQYRSES
jgi:hypothetical protein